MTHEKCYVTKIQVDSLFKCHVVGWRMIPPNQVGGKLFKKKKKMQIRHF